MECKIIIFIMWELLDFFIEETIKGDQKRSLTFFVRFKTDSHV